MSLFASKLIFGFSRLVLQPQATGPSRAFGLSAALANVRNHFPRPNEKKRIVRHGWLARLATKGGRAILMRRILKGRHVLSH